MAISPVDKLKIHAVVDQISENMHIYGEEFQDVNMEPIYTSIDTVRFLIDHGHSTRILSEMRLLNEQVIALRYRE